MYSFPCAKEVVAVVTWSCLADYERKSHFGIRRNGWIAQVISDVECIKCITALYGAWWPRFLASHSSTSSRPLPRNVLFLSFSMVAIQSIGCTCVKVRNLWVWDVLKVANTMCLICLFPKNGQTEIRSSRGWQQTTQSTAWESLGHNLPKISLPSTPSLSMDIYSLYNVYSL